MTAQRPLLATRLPTVADDAWIRLQLGKGVLLVLTQEKFVRALKRGKAVRRQMQRAQQVARGQAQREAAMLEWITEHT